MKLSSLDQLCEVLATPFSSEQLAAISAPLEPGVIVAGAGTGKTTVMAARVVWLVGTGQVGADQVLGLTFTRKAAAELGQRITTALAKAHLADDLDHQGSELVMTYDAFAGRLVRDFGLRLGIEAESQLLSGASRHRLAAQALAQHDNTLVALSRLRHHSVPERILALDAALSSNLVSPDQLRAFSKRADEQFAAAPLYRGKTVKAISDARQAIAERLELLGLVEDYRSLKEERGLVEFADQQAQAVTLATTIPQVGQQLRERFSVVLLDEYQDTSSAQVRLLQSLWSGATPELGRGFPVTAVGDPNQAIYAWRGAAASNISGFPAHFPRIDGSPAHSYSLRINRRSGQRILNLGNALAASLGTGVALQAPADKPPGRIIAGEYNTLAEELAAVAADIAQRGAAGQNWREMAVLTRRNDILAATYQALKDRDIPVEIVGLGGLIHLPEIAPIIDTLRLLVDPLDNAATANQLTGPRWRFGLADMVALSRRAKDIDPDKPSLVDALADPGTGLSEVAQQRAEEFIAELTELRSYLSYPVADLVRAVITHLGIETEQLLIGDLTQVHRFAAACADFPTLGMASDLAGLLAWLQAEEEDGQGLEQALPSDENSVKLLTMHRAKGLEWDTVYLPGLTEGIFPAVGRDGTWVTNPRLLPAPLRGDAPDIVQLGSYDRGGIEDYKAEVKAEAEAAEDRLAYVAATRARQLLVASSHTWAPGLKRPRGASRYYGTAAELADEVNGCEPTAANPEPEAARRAVWPLDPSPRDRAQQASADLVREATQLLASGQDPESWVWRSGVTHSSDQRRIESWDEDIAFLSEQLSRRADRDITLPPGLSATALMDLQADPEAFISRLLRRMPSQPRRSARLGERFHEWVVSRFGAAPAFDELIALPAATDPALERLKAAFEDSQFARMHPLAVEVPFVLRWRGIVLRGRIDAVFPSLDADHDALIVDWKIGSRDPDPLQLAIYRQAWAQAHDLIEHRVATGFHHVLANRFETIEAGPELIDAAVSGLKQ